MYILLRTVLNYCIEFYYYIMFEFYDFYYLSSYVMYDKQNYKWFYNSSILLEIFLFSFEVTGIYGAFYYSKNIFKFSFSSEFKYSYISSLS